MRPTHRSVRGVAIATCVAVLLLVLPSRFEGHEIPPSVVVQMLVKPEPGTLRVLLRVPLEAMRDMEFPERDDGSLDAAAAVPQLRLAVETWLVPYLDVFEDGRKLPTPAIGAVRAALPSDHAFDEWARAVTQVRSAPLADTVSILWKQAMLDVLLEYPIASAEARFSVRPTLAHLGVRTATAVRLLTPAGAERVFEWTGNPGLVQLDPRWYQAAWRFVAAGFAHILDGIDHLLFIICLVIPFRRVRSLIAIVTAFTVAHSITLVGTALGLAPDALWFPPLIEVLIAASIVFMAFENIVGPRLDRRWLIAFLFGLVHGFGFAFSLRESLQFAGSHLATSLAAFNVGVEIGQVAVLLVAVPALDWIFRKVVAERMGTILLSALVAHTAWHWMTARWSALTQYRFSWPVLDATFGVAILRLLMFGAVAGGALWLLWAIVGSGVQRTRQSPSQDPSTPIVLDA